MPFMNFNLGFEKWVNTLSLKLASWGFAVDAILVSFTMRQHLSCFISKVGILPKNGGMLLHFFYKAFDPDTKIRYPVFFPLYVVKQTKI